MMNTKFREEDKETVEKMTKLYSQIFAVLMNVNKPILSTVVYLNENFERIYQKSPTEVDVYTEIFKVLDVSYSDINKENDQG